VPFHPSDRPVPSELHTDDAVLRPLTVAHAVIDHAALMSSKERLRRWSGTEWPTDDFSVEENRRDLDRHDTEHRTGIAYTFTVLSPDEQTCIGCVYVTPLEQLVPENPELGAVSPHDAVVGFWTSDERSDLEARLLGELDRWFGGEWAFTSVRFSTNAADLGQVELMERHGFRKGAQVEVPGRRGPYLLWER
jgi:RimJ/RimL family protein N-acetyltransferase